MKKIDYSVLTLLRPGDIIYKITAIANSFDPSTDKDYEERMVVSIDNVKGEIKLSTRKAFSLEDIRYEQIEKITTLINGQWWKS